MASLITRFTHLSTKIVSEYIKPGQIVVDATMGNGNDTLFLARQVGEKGVVYAFDIQEEALLNTRLLLEKELNSTDNIYLINDSHENIKEHLNENVDIIVFNLGYLPKSDHQVTTNYITTLNAINNCLDVIKKDGLICIMIYQGHDAGKLEKNEIEKYAKTLDPKIYHVVNIEALNQNNLPPSILLITKKVEDGSRI